MCAQDRSIPWTTLFFALLGLAWCGYVAFPTTTPLPCSTSGCALFRDSRFAGISLWWVGGAYFFLMAVICLKGNRSLARMLAGVALFLDAVLLVIMFLTAPCFDCLVVGALIGICYYSVRPSTFTKGWFTGAEHARSLLLPVWFGLLLGNSAVTADEFLPLYNIGAPQTKELSVYFSPSCPACRDALLAFGTTAALYPVDESGEDFDSIIRLGTLLKADIPMEDALRRCLDQDEPMPALPAYERALLRMQILRNKAALMRQGFRALPLILINGMPGGHPSTPLERSSLTPREQTPGPAAIPDLTQPRAEPQTDAQPPTEMPDFLNDPGPLRQCGGDNPEPCD